MKAPPLLSAVALAALFFSGCASVSVTGIHKQTEVTKPTVIYVQDYDTRGGNWKITSRSLSPDQFKAKYSTMLAESVVKDLNKYVGPAQRIAPGQKVPPGAWLVTGRFTRVSEGNPAGRMVVGLGLGSSKLETETTVYGSSRAKKPFLQFGTTGGSNAMPGMIFSTSPFGVAFTALAQGMRGVKDDSHRTSKMITAAIGEYMVEKGWLKSSKVKVKEPGKFQLVQPSAMDMRSN